MLSEKNHKTLNDVTNQSVFSLETNFNKPDIALKTANKYTNKHATCSGFIFNKRLNNVLNTILDEDFDWSNVFLAGGLISLLIENELNMESLKKSDIDLFLYGSKKIQIDKIKYIYNYIMTKYNGDVYVFMYKNTSVLTFLIPGKRPLQVIGHLTSSNGTLCDKYFKNYNDILTCFDFTHCQIGFDGNELRYTPEFVKAITTRITEIPKNVTSIRAYRIVKAYLNGYDIRHPGKKIFIKNTLVCDYESLAFPKDAKKFYNVDKVRSFDNLEKEIYEMLKNHIIMINLERNYVPDKYDENFGENEIKKYYGGEKRDIIYVLSKNEDLDKLFESIDPCLVCPSKF